MIQVSAPSNIAFLKYWGKQAQNLDTPYGQRNIPLNPSLSMTLKKAQSSCLLERSANFLQIFMNGTELSQDSLAYQKIMAHIEFLKNELVSTTSSNFSYIVRTENNFPAGTGMASSASFFAALTCALYSDLTKNPFSAAPLSLLSAWARAGSGSACRSVSGPFMLWDSTEARALNVQWKLYDLVVIFSRKEKKISSSEGHQRVLTSPFWNSRMEKIPSRLELMRRHLENKNLLELGPLIEEEADDLHQITESSAPPIFYKTPSTQMFLDYIKNLPSRNFFYTLDAGPNVHLISEKNIENEIKAILEKLHLNAELWSDEIGPERP